MANCFYKNHGVAVPVDERVIEKMMHYLMLDGIFGSPASRAYYSDWKADHAINIAREYVADRIGAQSQDIIFTSGCLSSNNMVVKALLNEYRNNGRHVIICHSQDLNSSRLVHELESEGYSLTMLLSLENNIVNPDEIKKIRCWFLLRVLVLMLDLLRAWPKFVRFVVGRVLYYMLMLLSALVKELLM